MEILNNIRKKIRKNHLIDENELIPDLINSIKLSDIEKKDIILSAASLVEVLR